MADEKKGGIFKRPTQPAAGVIGPDADRFVSGTSSVEPLRVEESAPQKAPHQVATEQPEEEKLKRLTIDIPESLHMRVKSGCALEGTTMKDEVVAFLEKRFPPKS